MDFQPNPEKLSCIPMRSKLGLINHRSMEETAKKNMHESWWWMGCGMRLPQIWEEEENYTCRNNNNNSNNNNWRAELKWYEIIKTSIVIIIITIDHHDLLLWHQKEICCSFFDRSLDLIWSIFSLFEGGRTGYVHGQREKKKMAGDRSIRWMDQVSRYFLQQTSMVTHLLTM